MKKLRTCRGESLAEVLIAVLIMSLTFLFLAGAVVSAAKINDRLKNQDAAFRTAKGEEETVDGNFPVLVGGFEVGGVTLYRTENGYYYYE